MTEIFKPDSKTILELFNGSLCYQIPSYQRPYSWKSEHVEALWNDIYQAFESAEEEYFLGSIILIKKDTKNLDVVDGQQRITTLMILFCALRDLYYDKITDFKKKNLILGRIKNLETDSERLQLKTQLQNQNQFAHEILYKINYDAKLSKTELEKNTFLNAAYIFKYKIIDLVDSDSEKLEMFVNYLLDKVRVITIECSNKSLAIKLFQVLNSKGMNLTSADLIKGDLMSRLKDEDIPIFESDWVNIENKAKELDEEIDDLFTYYEYYLLGANPKRTLHKELEFCFKGRDPKEVIYDFKKMIDHFYDINSENSKLIYSLIYLNQKVYWKSILLTAKMEGWNSDNLVLLEKLLRKFYYLYWIAEYTSTKTKQTSFNIITAIKNKKSIQQLTEMVDNKLKEDRVVNKVISNLNKNIYEYKWCKPLFMLIEYQQTDNTSFTYQDLDKFVHIEHILPQGYAKINYWKNLYSQEQADKLVNTVGNLTLLSGKKNIEASNRPFPDKISIYNDKGIDGATGYRITQKLFDGFFSNNNWTIERISERKKWILQEIGKLFDIDPFQEINDNENEEETINESVQETYNHLQEKILALGSDVRIEPKKYYVAFKRKSNFVTVELQQNKIKLWFDYDKEQLVDTRGILRDVSEIGHHGTGDLEVDISKLDDVDYVINFLKLAYDANEFVNDQDTKQEFNEEYLKNKTENSEMYGLLLEFRKELKQLTNFDEKINKYYVGFKNTVYYFTAFRIKTKFCSISVMDVPTNPNLSDPNIDYFDKYQELVIKVHTKDDIKKYIPLVKLSRRYKQIE